MDLKGKLKQGMRIFGSDDREYGTVERYDDDSVYVGGRKVPHSAFDRMDKDRLYVGRDGGRYFESGQQGRGMTQEGEIRVPVVEERLDVEKRQVDMGSVDVRKTVESERVNVPVELTRDEVDVRREDVADRPIAAGEMGDAFKEGTIRVPIRGEEAVVSKEAVVTGEVAIDRERVTERETVSDTVRQERVTVDENVDKGRSTGGTQNRQPGRTEPTTERAVGTSERTAETSRSAPRPEGKAGDGESWDELHEDVRDADKRTRR